jgi:hypothetical protein
VYGRWALMQRGQAAEATAALKQAGVAPALLRTFWALAQVPPGDASIMADVKYIRQLFSWVRLPGHPMGADAADCWPTAHRLRRLCWRAWPAWCASVQADWSRKHSQVQD